jgi:hypothetical protein
MKAILGELRALPKGATIKDKPLWNDGIRQFHYLATAALVLGLLPAFRLAHLPLRFTWEAYFVTYWWSLAFQATVAAILLYAIGFPSEFRKKLTSRQSAGNPREPLLALFIPAAYLFLVLILVFSYNDVIATLRFQGTADVVLNRMDSWMLGGATVSSLARGLSPRASKILEGIYFLMFSQIGACLILLALRCGRRTAMRFVATIATAYYIALIVFYFVPAAGPYYLSAINHDGNYVGAGQLAFVGFLNSMRDHHPLPIVGTDYYIALPCLHITQPLIMIWFVRKWKPIAFVLSAYCLALIPAVLLLQQHYLVDVIGGVVVAAIAIAVTFRPDPGT